MTTRHDRNHRRSVWRVGTRFAAGLVASLALAGPAAADCNLELMEIPVHLVNQRPIATITLDGVDVPMLVDTGAFFSMLTPAVAEQLKLRLRQLPNGMRIQGWTGNVDAKLTKVSKVKLQQAELNDLEFIVGVNELGSGIGGVLGRNFLSVTDVEYDLAHGMVRLVFPKGDCTKTNLAYWAGDAPVIEVELVDRTRWDVSPAIIVDIRLNDRKARALLDTGAPYTVVTLPGARDAGVKDEDLLPLGTSGGGGRGRVQSWTAEFKSFALGGEKIVNNRFQVDAVSAMLDDVLLGLDYFLSHRILVSKLQGKLYATWNGGRVFALARTAATAEASPYAASAPVIADDNTAALARRGAAAAARRDYEAALADLTRAVMLEPQNAAHLVARARVHVAMRAPAKALLDLDAALALDPAQHDARLQRAWMRRAADDLPGTQADLQALDAALPPSAHLRASMADLYSRMDMVPEALRQWDLWVPSHKRDGGLANVLNNRCFLRTRANIELQKALDDCKEAVDLAGVELAYHDSLAWTYLRLGDAARARKSFDAALQRRHSAFSTYGRSLALRRLGDTAAADRDLAAARNLQPDIDEEVRKEGFQDLVTP